jgi:outer membrane lipoprotein-sorting protein
MKKLSIILLLLAGLFISASAQNDPEAKTLFDKAWNTINGYKGIEAEYVFEVSKGENAPHEKYTGKVKLKGDKFYFDAGDTHIYSDGKTRWVYMPEVEEVNISNQIGAEGLEPEDRLMNAPLSLFSMYKSGFKYSHNGKQLENGKNYLVADISPENKEKIYFKVRYWFNEDYTPAKIKIFQKDGSRITFSINGFKENKGLKDKEFKFDPKKFPNAELIDLRE